MAGEQHGQAVADELGADTMVRRTPFIRENPMIFDSPTRRDPQVRRAPSSAGIYDVLDLILDKGMVIDAFVRVSLVGIELLTIDLRIVIASVDTYLRYAEGAERLQINERSDSRNIPEMVGGKMKSDTIKQGAQKLGQAITGGSGGDGEGEVQEDQGSKRKGVMPALAGGMRKMLSRGVGRIVGRIAGDDRYEDQPDDQGQEQQKGEGQQQKQQPRQGQQKGERGGGGGGRQQSRGKPQPARAKARARR